MDSPEPWTQTNTYTHPCAVGHDFEFISIPLYADEVRGFTSETPPPMTHLVLSVCCVKCGHVHTITMSKAELTGASKSS